jgi:hypothetical protein
VRPRPELTQKVPAGQRDRLSTLADGMSVVRMGGGRERLGPKLGPKNVVVHLGNSRHLAGKTARPQARLTVSCSTPWAKALTP